MIPSYLAHGQEHVNAEAIHEGRAFSAYALWRRSAEDVPIEGSGSLGGETPLT